MATAQNVDDRLSQRATRWLVHLAWPTAVVMTLLLVSRRDVLFLPPYEDRAVATWTEGKFLADTQFDYLQLRYDQKNWMDGGGVRSYLISWVPTFCAVLMREIPIPKYTFLVHHAVMFLAASLTVALVIRSIQPRAGTLLGWLAGAVVLTSPPFWTQSQMIGEDTALAMFGLAGFCLLAERQYLLAGLALLLSFFTKANGMVFTLAAGCFVLIAALLGSGRWTQRLWPTLVMFAVLAIELIASAWADDPAIFLGGAAWSPMLKPPEVLLFFPDVSLLWIGSITLATLFVVGRIRRADLSFQSIREVLARLIKEEPLTLLSWIYLVGLSVALCRYFVMMRYVVPGIPLTIILLGHLLPKSRRLRGSFIVGLSLLLLFQLANRHGDYYPGLAWLGKREFAYWTWWNERMCGLTERSEEYREDLDRVIEVIRHIETNYPHRPVYVELAYGYYLRTPELGYVSRPHPNLRLTVDFAETMKSLNADLASSADPILVWSGKSRHLLPKPDDDAEILFDDRHPLLPVKVYRLRPERIPTDPQAREDWLLDKSWGPEWILQRALSRQSYLRATGRIERWKTEIDAAIASPSTYDYLGLREVLRGIRANP